MENDIGRALWLEERRKGIGGTDAAAILGLSRYSSPLQVWLHKKNLAPSIPDNEAMWWGRATEPLIAQRFAESGLGREVWKPSKFVRHPEHDCLIGSVDYLLAGDPAGLECKTSRRDDDWGDPGTDQVPSGYIIQCQHYMALTGFRTWYLAALIAGSDFRVYVIRGDEELQGIMIERLVAWWDRYVLGGERPEMDGTDETSRWIASRFPVDREPLVRAPIEANAIAHGLWRARTMIDEAAEVRAARENALKEIIGEHAGVEGEGWRATWKKARSTKRVDYQLLAEDLYQRLAGVATLNSDIRLEPRADLLERYTNETPGSRRFLFSWAGSDE